MKLNDKELEKVICYKIGKFSGEELEEADIEKVEEVNISNKSFSGKMKDINLQELRLFPNIKRISLQYFLLDDSLIELLNSFERLDYLQLASCELTEDMYLKNDSLKSLALNSCKIKDYEKIFAPENLYLVGQENVRLGDLSGKDEIRRLFIQNSSVKGFKSISEFLNLRMLNLDGSKIDDKDSLEEVKRKIPVSHQDRYEPIK